MSYTVQNVVKNTLPFGDGTIYVEGSYSFIGEPVVGFTYSKEGRVFVFTYNIRQKRYTANSQLDWDLTQQLLARCYQEIDAVANML